MPNYMPPPSALPPGSTVWAYLRDSGGPGQEQSVPQQEAEVRDYCKQHGLVLIRVFSDIGKSGGNVKQRVNFMAMLDMSEDKTIRPAGILVWNFARFSRDVDDSDYYKATIRKRGVAIHSLTDPIPDGQWAGVVEKIIDIANEEKRRQNSRDVKRALESLVKQGYAPGGTAPRGYQSVPVTIGTRADGRPRTVPKWERDPELWDLVKLAWQMRADGKTYGDIVRATHGKLYKVVNCWITFFSNKSYLGIGKCGDLEVPSHHEAAVDLATWEAVQRIQKSHPRVGLRHPMRIAYPSLLSGLACCSHCGAAMIYHAQASRNWPYYICGKHDRQKAIKICDGRRVNARKVNALILDTVLNQILTPDYFEALLTEIKKQMIDTASLEAEIKDKSVELRAVERAVQNLLDLAESFGPESALARLKQREAESRRLAAEIKGLETRREALAIEITPAALALVLDTWRAEIIEINESGDIAVLRNLLARFVEKIDLDYTTVKIWYTYPIDSLTRPHSDSPLGGTTIFGCSQGHHSGMDMMAMLTTRFVFNLGNPTRDA
jgi:DNA invertase Pin-like site-specific DNA recombinase